ncbi:SDR family oxidoreductase [Streptomyces sp. NPDC017941]|uniref:SDR family oxidoreductase n=1 Tax=Streptomyces sp. NPDC017941 TaxID=3365018 RepID=UPI003796A11E
MAQVGALGVVEAQRPRDGVEDAVGDVPCPALFEPYVVIDAHPCQLRQLHRLLPAQPGNPTAATERADTAPGGRPGAPRPPPPHRPRGRGHRRLQRIGEATAWELAAQGAHVAVLTRRGERLAEHAARIEEAGGTAPVLPADVTGRASLASAAAGVRARFGRVDLVVDNAGLALPDRLDGSAGGTRQRMVDVHVTGAFAVADEFVPDLLATAAERGRADLVDISAAPRTGPHFSE